MGVGGVREQRADDDTGDGKNDSRKQALQTPTHMEPAKFFGGNVRECPLLPPLGSAGSAAPSPVPNPNWALVKHAL